jgi:hypothetical protein
MPPTSIRKMLELQTDADLQPYHIVGYGLLDFFLSSLNLDRALISNGFNRLLRSDWSTRSAAPFSRVQL